jgi:hypothetical protein
MNGVVADGAEGCSAWVDPLHGVFYVLTLMDTVEFQYDNVTFATFDGLVLEVFCEEYGQEGSVPPHAGSRRMLAKLLSVRVSNPDRKGHRTVELWGPSISVFEFNKLDEAACSRVQPLLDAFKAAGVEFLDPLPK